MVPCHVCGKPTSTALDRAHFVKPRSPDDEPVTPDGKVKVYYCPACQEAWKGRAPKAARTALVLALSLAGGVAAAFLWGAWWAGPPVFFTLGFLLFMASDYLSQGRHSDRPRK